MTTITTERASVGWSVWLQWLIATTVGMAVGGFLALGVVWSIFDAVGSTLGEPAGFIAFGAVFGTAIGVGLGTAQSIILRSRIAGSGVWAPVSFVAGLVGGALSGLLTSMVGWSAGLAVFGALLGISIGIAQWLVLRRSVPNAGWWAPATTVGSILLFVAAGNLGGEGREFIALSVGAALFGGVTGLALVGLLRRPAAEA